MVLEDKYTDATTELKPTAPTNPTEPVPVSSRTSTRANPINYDDTKEEFRAYTVSKSKYSQYHNTSRCIVKQIIVAVSMIYVQELSHPITKFGNVEPHTIIEHRKINYDTVIALDLGENERRMRTSLVPPYQIEEIYRRLTEGKHFAEEASDTMEHSILVRTGYKIIHATGQFIQACYKWRKVTRPQQTVFNSCIQRSVK